jgi:1-acyl-sn-glycerol-3-phosphate acyltransferase
MTWFRWGFGRYVRWRLARGLDGVWVRNLELARTAVRGGPVVFAATHVSWWDAMVLFALDDALGNTTRAWMDAANLRRHPYFGPLGALPLDASGPGALRRSLREAAAWLTGPQRALWVFPQGRYVPQWLRPLELERGTAVLARQARATVVPVAFAYGFGEGPTPRAVVSFGPPVDPEHLEEGLLRELAATDRFLAAPNTDFELLVAGAGSGEERSFAARALAWATGRG